MFAPGVIYIRTKLLCFENRISISRLETKLGFAKATIQKWKESYPLIDKVVAVADYFNVSIDYLTGRTELRATAENCFDNEEYREAHRKYERLNPRTRKESADFFSKLNDMLYSAENLKEDNKN